MRLILAALVGAVVLFVCGFVMYVVLGYHWKVIHPMPQEEQVATTLKGAIPETGVYLIPAPMTEGGTEAQKGAWADKHKAGPVGMVFWQTQGSDPMSIEMHIRGFVINFLAAMCAAMIARFAAVAGANFARRWATIMVMAMFAGASVHLMNWNYWHLPDGYTGVAIADLIVAWALAAVPIAWMVGKK
jgi:hypothetical protein